MLTLDAAAVRQSTPWNELMEAIERLLIDRNASVPQREIHDVGLPDGGTGSLLVMPAWVDCGVLGVKAVTYYPSNAGTDLPTISAGYLLFDGQTGQLSAVLDGDELTLRRTAAVSALAADRLARPDARRLLVAGTGKLAPNLALAHAAVRDFDAVEVWGRSPQRAAATAQQLVEHGLPAQPADSLDEAVGRADVISCATGATSPLLRGALVRPGTHIDLVGAFRADMREADDEAVRRATLFVDTLDGALGAGDLAQPLDAGVISAGDIAADLASLAALRHPGRTSDSEITLFKSVGFALSDLAAARLVHRRIATGSAGAPDADASRW